MNLLVDESVDQQVVEELRRDGTMCCNVAEAEPGILEALVLTKTKDPDAVMGHGVPVPPMRGLRRASC